MGEGTVAEVKEVGGAGVQQGQIRDTQEAEVTGGQIPWLEPQYLADSHTSGEVACGQTPVFPSSVLYTHWFGT